MNMRSPWVTAIFLLCFALTLSSCSLFGNETKSGWKKHNVKEPNFSFQYPKELNILDHIDEDDAALYIDSKNIEAKEDGSMETPIVIHKGGIEISKKEIVALENKERSERIIDGKEVEYIKGRIAPKDGKKAADGFIIIVNNPNIIIVGNATEESGFNVENTLNEILETMDFE